jgi:hypothetical protein
MPNLQTNHEDDRMTEDSSPRQIIPVLNLNLFLTKVMPTQSLPLQLNDDKVTAPLPKMITPNLVATWPTLKES